MIQLHNYPLTECLGPANFRGGEDENTKIEEEEIEASLMEHDGVESSKAYYHAKKVVTISLPPMLLLSPR